jgi:PmbA protein
MMNVEKALKILSKEAEEAEVFFSKDVTKKVEIRKGEVGIFKESSSTGYGVRIVRDKRMGFAFSNQLDERVLNIALKVAEASEKDEHLSLPGRQRYGRVKGGFDKKIEGIGVEEALEFVKQLIEPCERQKVIPTQGAIVWTISEVEISNSHGVEGMDKGTVISAYPSTVVKEDGVASGFYYDVSRTLDLNFSNIGKEATRLARESLHAKGIDTINTDLILKPLAVSELFENVLIPSFNADNVQRNRSFLKGKLGEAVFSEIDIVDDGTLEGGLMTGKFDSEGVKTQRTPLVREGILSGYLYDTYTASKEDTESTGNANRDSYSSLPKVDSSNFIISGKGEIEEGLVVHGLIGAHTSNPISGDFSVETRNAFLEGKPVKKAIISGNIFELLRKVKGFGEDYKQFSSVLTPTIQFSDVRVVG